MLWTGYLDKKGYGVMEISGKQARVHRIVHESNFGPIPKDQSVLRTCANRHCVNPDHLYLGKREYFKAPVKERFESKLQITPGCWNWTASVFSQTGYGQFEVDGKNGTAHRFSYELYVGPIPGGLYILHSCDNRRCVNPDHLRTGTQLENMADMASRDRGTSGGKNRHAKLHEDQICEIHFSTKTHAQLAIEYGISQSQISDIKNLKAWRHVERWAKACANLAAFGK